MDKYARICVVGNKGTLGQAVCRQLEIEGYANIILCDLPEVDCTCQADVKFFLKNTDRNMCFFLQQFQQELNINENIQ